MAISFTQAGLGKLVGQIGQRQVIHDPKTQGLRAELREGGRVTFYLFRRMPGGRPIRVRLGTFPEITIDQARNHAHDLIGRMAKGENVAHTRRSKREEPTLKALFDHFLADAKLRKKSWPEDERIFNKYLVSWHTRKLSAITKPDVKAWHTRLGIKHGRYQANRALSLLRAIYNRADELGYEGTNPAAKVQPFPEEERDRFLQPEELPRFFQAVANDPSEVVRDFILLAIFTGERRSQVAAMRWDDVSLDRAEWRLPAWRRGNDQNDGPANSGTKQKKVHYVHLTEPAIKILLRRKETANGEWVLPGRRNGQHLKDPMKNWRRILLEAGIEGVRIHDLRRTLGSYMAIGGASLPIIGKALGHSQPSTTKIYARLTDSTVKTNVVDAVKLIEESAKPKDD